MGLRGKSIIMNIQLRDKSSKIISRLTEKSKEGNRVHLPLVVGSDIPLTKIGIGSRLRAQKWRPEGVTELT